MSFTWHQILENNLGSFSPESGFIHLNYSSLALNTQRAELTYYHEFVHLVLSGSTEFGLATESIFRFLPKLNNLNNKNKIILLIKNNQIKTQEGAATLMQLLVLRQQYGIKDALKWAKDNLPERYYSWVKPLFFVLKMSEKHRNLFTSKIPHIAMHTDIRKSIFKNKLLENEFGLMGYLNNVNNSPDYRFKKLANAIKDDCFLVLKKPKEICLKAGINYYAGTTKQNVVDFLNYLSELTSTKEKIATIQIKNFTEQKKYLLNDAENKIIVSNLNLKLSDTAGFLPLKNDVLFYKDEIEVILINLLSKEIKNNKLYEIIFKKKIDFGGIIMCKDGSNYTTILSRNEAIDLINNDLKNKTFVVKWGLYDFGQNGIMSTKNIRVPNFVIYNTVKDLEDKLKESGYKQKTKFLHFSASENSPIQGIILKDHKNVLHIVSTFGNKSIFNIKKYDNLVEMNICELEVDAKHLNNIFSFWLGLNWKLDWYKIMVNKDTVYFRK